MKIKQEAAIVVIVTVALLGILLLAYAYQKQKIVNTSNLDELNARMAQEAKNRENEKLVDDVIQKRVEEKRQELGKKPQEEIRKNGYSQDEVNFILDPKKTVQKELGIEVPAVATTTRYTQAQIDSILNPTKK